MSYKIVMRIQPKDLITMAVLVNILHIFMYGKPLGDEVKHGL
jgi:hypothetical protein